MRLAATLVLAATIGGTAAADPVVEIAAGSTFACALRASGGVWCWGKNAWDASPERCRWSWNGTDYPCHRRPTRVPIGPALHLAAGEEVACALLASGRAACWGYNLTGALGDGTTEARTRPVVIEGARGVVQLATGGFHTCVLDGQGAVRCWGRNVAGQLGDGSRDDRARPGAAIAHLPGVARITVGTFHACALLRGGRVACWGENGNGQLGDGTTVSRATPVRVRGLPPVVEVVAGHQATCARSERGRVWCWGAVGRLAPGLPVNGRSSRPVAIPAMHDVRQLALGLARACALVGDDGQAFCWGERGGGERAGATPTDVVAPRPVAGRAGVAQIAVAWENTCVLAGGRVACWGHNDFGQLGDGGTEDRFAVPLPPPSPPTPGRAGDAE